MLYSLLFFSNTNPSNISPQWWRLFCIRISFCFFFKKVIKHLCTNAKQWPKQNSICSISRVKRQDFSSYCQKLCLLLAADPGELLWSVWLCKCGCVVSGSRMESKGKTWGPGQKEQNQFFKKWEKNQLRSVFRWAGLCHPFPAHARTLGQGQWVWRAVAAEPCQ